MPVCSFNNCMTGSKSKHVVKIMNRPVTTHRFPKDPYMRKLWQDQAQRGYKKYNINFESGLYSQKYLYNILNHFMYQIIYRLKMLKINEKQ